MARRKKSKFFIRAIVSLAIIYAALAWLRPLPALTATANLPVSPTLAAASLDLPAKGQMAIGADGFGILAQSSQQKPLPVASTIKILTALAVLSKKPLALGQPGPIITLGAADVAAYQKYVSEDGSTVPVTAGEQISEYQALEALLLPSANNIAYSLSVWAFGSLNNFLTYTNNYAKTLGLSQTRLADASGFSPNTTSTAHDLTLLGLKSLDNPVLSQIVGQTQATIPVAGVIKNVNWQLGVDGITGIKTGNTDQAGGCFIFSAKEIIQGHSVKVVGAVVGDVDLTTALSDGLALANSSTQNFSLIQPVKAGQVIGYYNVPWVGQVDIKASQDISFLNWADKAIAKNAKLVELAPPAAMNKNVGSVQYTFGSGSASSTAYLAQPIAKPSFTWRLAHPFF